MLRLLQQRFQDLLSSKNVQSRAHGLSETPLDGCIIMGGNGIESHWMEIILARIQRQAKAQNIRVTQHAQKEMDDEGITLDEVLEAIANGQILEDYSGHRRGACCLLYGCTHKRRHLHVICTTAQQLLIIITVYQPLPPKWVNPTQRRKQ